MSSSLTFDVARQVCRSGSFELACSADTAFPLFSPEGEREWINGWDPQPVFPQEIAFQRDTVFRQGNGDEEAIWTIVRADWQAHTAEYVRVAPASHAAHIVVSVEKLAAAECKVQVAYAITLFGEGGAILDAFSEEAYEAKMRNWQQWIGDLLDKRKRDRARHDAVVA